MKRKNEKGITLIALVVTIVVLLILAGISISMLAGENGIIKQAQESKDETGQAKVEESVKLAITSLMAENKGDKSTITPEMIANQVNKDENRTDVQAEGSTFPTNIIFEEEGRKVGVDINLSITQPSTTPEESEDAIFSNIEGMSEEELITEAEKNMELFDYEIIDDGSVASIDMTNLPTKTARITGIKPIYCSGFAGTYNDESYENTNYEINYKGEKITDTLVIPYQVEIDGEIYKITESNITAIGDKFYGLPEVQTIIYPNTIEKIEINKITDQENTTIQEVILSKNLKAIGVGAFMNCTELRNIIIPEGVTSIEENTFRNCTSLKNAIIPESVTKIGDTAFYACSGLTTIIIPEKVTSIGEGAFGGCAFTSINIPENVTSIGNSAFSAYALTSIVVDPNNKVYDSRENCNAIIETSTNTLIQGCKNTIIPTDISKIGYQAFINCKGLTSIEIPNKVTNIGIRAFQGCEGLTSITIPNNIAKIQGDAFYNCTNLTEVYFEPETAPVFGDTCFLKFSGAKTIFYFKNSTVADAFTTSHYNSSYGEKSPNYDW